jgi:hypothetical protein
LQIVVPRLSREEATALLSSDGSSIAERLIRRTTNPIRTELVFLPYYCFELELSGATSEQCVHVAIDGLVGEGVFFISDELDYSPLCNEEHCRFELELSEAEQIVLDQYKRMLLEHGLRNKTQTIVGGIAETRQLLYPFWIGYLRKGEAYDFKALDAISGAVQGIRMRKVFLKAFRQLESG